LYLHGGYNTLQPSPFHWRLLDKLTLNTLHEVVLPIYPKSPDYHYLETFKAIRDVYNQLVEEVGASNIVMMGDGSGGGLALSFVQSLINDNQEVPRKLFLLSPLLDATLTNPNITKTLEENDILVSRFGVHQLMKSWTNDLPLSDARISPLYGTLKGLPPIYMYGGGREILSPDMHAFTHALEECGNDVEFKEYPKMVHDFPIYPIRQSHKVLKHITKSILE
ncbi:esterase, partial [Paenibacillus macerans]